MGLRINQNIAAMNAYRNLTVTEGQMGKSLEKLSSGFRINRAADDAAGLSISEGLRSQVGGTKVAIRNAQDGISVVQTAEGALSEVHSILQRMRDLAVQAANTGSNGGDIDAVNTEVDKLKEELDRIATTTTFGGKALLDGTFGLTNATYTGSVNAAAGVTMGAGTEDLDFSVGAGAAVTVSFTAAENVTAASLEAKLQAALAADGQIDAATKVSVTRNSDNFLVVEVADGESFKFATGTGGAATHAAATTILGAASIAGTDNLTAGDAAQADFDAVGSARVFQVGANGGVDNQIAVNITQDMSAEGLSLDTLDLASTTAIADLDTAIEAVSTARAELGAYQNRFEHTIANLSVASENLSASESRIRDTDMAQEMVSFTRAQILTQAGTAMLAQANQAPQQVLQLLRG